MDIINKLNKKTIIWDGDSICAGSALCGNWATRISERNEMVMKNYAVGGGTITENPPRSASGAMRHSVSANLDRMHEEFPDADYIIFEGGTNDADLIGNAFLGGTPTRLGSFVEGYYGGDFDRDTFCGALESIFYRATKYWMGKKIGFIVAQKMGCDVKSSRNRRLYFDYAVKTCQKWGIPCLDLWNGCYLNPCLEWMYDKNKTADENRSANTGFYIDGQHLTSRGYDFTSEIIEGWLLTL